MCRQKSEKLNLKADLVAIDDIMLFPIKKDDATGFFNLINTLHEKTSIIITTNKAPTEWAATLDDEALASALLDRLLYHCEKSSSRVKATGWETGNLSLKTSLPDVGVPPHQEGTIIVYVEPKSSLKYVD